MSGVRPHARRAQRCEGRRPEKQTNRLGEAEQGGVRRNLVEREDGVVDVPVLHIHPAMRGISHAVDTELYLPHSEFCCAGSRRSNHILNWNDRAKEVRAS